MSEHPKKRKREQLNSTPISQLWNDSKFFSLSGTQMAIALQEHDTNLNILAATSILMVTLFSAGVQFTRKAHELTKGAAFSEAAKSFCQQMWRYLFSLNFAAAIVDPDYSDEPLPFLVLPLESLEVQVHRDYLGRMTFRYFRPGYPGSEDSTRQEILNVHTFILKKNFLDMCGNLSSTVISLLQVEDVYYSKKQNTLTADYARANPALITEHVAEKADKDFIQALPQTLEKLGNGFEPFQQHPSVSTTLEGGTNYSAARIPWGAPAVFPGQPKPLKHGDNYSSHVELGFNRKLVMGPVIEAPEQLLETATANKETVFEAFGVPLSLFSNVSNTAGAKKASGNSSSKQSTGENSNAKQIFYANLECLKKFSVHMLETLYNLYYLRSHYEELKAEAKKEDRKLTISELQEKAEVMVTIAGIPDDQVLKELFVSGCLTYQYYRDSTAMRYGIPIDAFNKQPELSVLEMNGMQLKPEPAKS